MNPDPRQPSKSGHHFHLADLLKRTANVEPELPRVLSEAEQRSLHVWMIEETALRFRMC